MPRIITLGRQFGSGGRELGRRLAEALQIAYYDHEIITEISKKTELSEAYVKSVLEQQPFSMMPINTARSLYFAPDPALSLKQSVYEEQTRILREMATKSDCLIVGRCADSILSDLKPLRIFVYADIEARIERCFERRRPEEEPLSREQMRKQILRVDKNRSRYYEFYTGERWGDPKSYDLCINTSTESIKELCKRLQAFIEA